MYNAEEAARAEAIALAEPGTLLKPGDMLYGLWSGAVGPVLHEVSAIQKELGDAANRNDVVQIVHGGMALTALADRMRQEAGTCPCSEADVYWQELPTLLGELGLACREVGATHDLGPASLLLRAVTANTNALVAATEPMTQRLVAQVRRREASTSTTLPVAVPDRTQGITVPQAPPKQGRQTGSSSLKLKPSRPRNLLILVGVIALVLIVVEALPSNSSQHPTTNTTNVPQDRSGNPGSAGSSATTAAPVITGYGATLSEWTATHIRDKNYDLGPAYGPIIQTPGGPTPQFIGVMDDGPPAATQRIIQFIESLPEGTSLATAKALTLAQLPADTARGAFDLSNQNGSCAFWNLRSATLAAVGAGGNNGAVVVEMAYDDSNGFPTYRPSDINTITIEVGQNDSTGTC